MNQRHFEEIMKTVMNSVKKKIRGVKKERVVKRIEQVKEK